MRRFLSRSIPELSRVLLVESGSRSLLDNLLPYLYENNPGMTADVVTCYAGQPENFFADQGVIYRIGEYPGSAGRQRLYSELRGRNYDALGIICSAEPIMTKWKWALAAKIPAKVFILNENGDYFWLDRGHARTVRHFALFRLGLTGAGAARTVLRLLLFPFTLLYLIAYALAVHARRRLRTL